jgi:hypothetical protein
MVWLCVINWLCVTCLTLVEFLVCSSNLQVGMWPNQSKSNPYKMASEDILIKSFQIIFLYKIYSNVSPLYKTLQLYFIWKEYLFSKLRLCEIRTRFPPYKHSSYFIQYPYKSIFPTTFPFTKIGEMGRIPLWYYSCLWKLWE